MTPSLTVVSNTAEQNVDEQNATEESVAELDVGTRVRRLITETQAAGREVTLEFIAKLEEAAALATSVNSLEGAIPAGIRDRAKRLGVYLDAEVQGFRSLSQRKNQS